MTAILLDVSKTLASLKKGGQKISWTKISNYRATKCAWFVSNYAALVDAQAVASVEESKALPGTLVQKLFEIYFKAGLYELPRKQVDLWFDINLYWMHHTIKYPAEASNLYNVFEWRKSAEAEQRVQIALDAGADYRVLDKIQPKFYNPANLEGGNEAQFLEILRTALRKNWTMFDGLFKAPAKVSSETYLQATFMGKMTANGQSDFMYNPHGLFASENSKGKPVKGFSIYDGKWNVSSWTDPDQLHFYAFIHMLRDRILPDRLAWLYWREAEIIDVPVEPRRLEGLKSSLFAISTVVGKLLDEFEALSSSGQKTIDITQVATVSLKYDRGGCKFCKLAGKCPEKQKYEPSAVASPSVGPISQEISF